VTRKARRTVDGSGGEGGWGRNQKNNFKYLKDYYIGKVDFVLNSS
jgi:hypothetical protein